MLSRAENYSQNCHNIFPRAIRPVGNMRVREYFSVTEGNMWNALLAINLAITRYEQTIFVLLSSEVLMPH